MDEYFDMGRGNVPDQHDPGRHEYGIVWTLTMYVILTITIVLVVWLR